MQSSSARPISCTPLFLSPHHYFALSMTLAVKYILYSCKVCQSPFDDNKMLLCDICIAGWHMDRLTTVPSWTATCRKWQSESDSEMYSDPQVASSSTHKNAKTQTRTHTVSISLSLPLFHVHILAHMHLLTWKHQGSRKSKYGERNCFYSIITQTYDLGLQSSR